MRKITEYPEWADIQIDMRTELHPIFKKVKSGISEYTFANIYLFRRNHSYQISRIKKDLYIFSGKEDAKKFFMLPFGLPGDELLSELFHRFDFLKGASGPQAILLQEKGYPVHEDRNNFDYIYRREELANLNGKKYRKKRNHINAFVQNYSYDGGPLSEKNIDDALAILNAWRKNQSSAGDYSAAYEALENIEGLQLCGSIMYVEGKPAAYTLGEELGDNRSFAIHFEKALDEYRGAYQVINKCFASLLPEKYEIINREQDIGEPGLRKSKMSYKPYGFVKKYRAVCPG